MERTTSLRLVRAAPEPLGLYVRAGRIDQKDLQSFIISRAAASTGAVFEAGGSRARSAFGCRDTNCCHLRIDDMLQAPARHFRCQRTQQVVGLGQIPESIRPSRFLEDLLRRASDDALKATKLLLPEILAQKVARQVKRLNVLRTTLVSYHVKNDGLSRSHRCAGLGAKRSPCRGTCKFCNDAMHSEGKRDASFLA